VNLNSNARIKITSQRSSIVVKCLEDSNVPEGMILLPVSIWSNQLTAIEGEEIRYKNIVVGVEPTNDSILSFNDLLRRIRGN
jgi:formylmethanofuran dehydrogenase subunit D